MSGNSNGVLFAYVASCANSLFATSTDPVNTSNDFDVCCKSAALLTNMPPIAAPASPVTASFVASAASPLPMFANDA